LIEIEWTETLWKTWRRSIRARRVKQSVERFAETGAGDVKKLQGIDPPEYASMSATTGLVPPDEGSFAFLRIR